MAALLLAPPLVAALLGACTGKAPGDSAQPGASMPAGGLFPSMLLVDGTGHVDIPAGTLPQAEGGVPFPVDRLGWRTGFSPVQTTVIAPEVTLDGSSLPGQAELGTAGSVQLWDLDAGELLPAMAELDAWCPTHPQDDACVGAVPSLLVRPLRPMPVGHQVAVAVTSAVRTADGAAWEGPAWAQDMRAGNPAPELADPAADMAQIEARLAELGVTDLVLAVEFPVGDGARPLRSIVPQVGIPTSWTFSQVADADAGDTVAPHTWKRLEGSFTTDSWLVDDGSFALSDGEPSLQGTAQATLYVHLPESLHDAPAGSAPVWIFGHGIFGEPGLYLDEPDDPSGLLELADRAGAIVVATTWRGLTRADLLTAVQVGNDPAVIPALSDKLAQGVANTIALHHLVVAGGLLDDPLLEGKGDPTTVRYYGISLGGIEGAVLLANDPEIPCGVLHVGGSSWSTMLERSSDWPTFETLVTDSVPSPGDRQLLYAAMQLFWDEADPASFTTELQGRCALWQESIGDDQVPNLTTESLARGTGATLLLPSVTTPWGIPTGAAPLSGPAVAQFDPERGVPPDINRPAEQTGAHGVPRLWNGTMEQTLRFLDPTDPGVVEHFCGEGPCTADNPG